MVKKLQNRKFEQLVQAVEACRQVKGQSFRNTRKESFFPGISKGLTLDLPTGFYSLYQLLEFSVLELLDHFRLLVKDVDVKNSANSANK